MYKGELNWLNLKRVLFSKAIVKEAKGHIFFILEKY